MDNVFKDIEELKNRPPREYYVVTFDNIRYEYHNFKRLLQDHGNLPLVELQKRITIELI